MEIGAWELEIPTPMPGELQSVSIPVTRCAAHIALTGNPNCGKTTLFNALTGLRAKVGNYAGVTVERKEGRLRAAPAGISITVLDLPGTYSLAPRSPDEMVAVSVVLGWRDLTDGW